MPKADTVRRIDNVAPSLHATPLGAVYSGWGMADTLDGYDASPIPGPHTIPVSLNDGKLHPGWLPEQAAAGEGASPLGGQVYVAPWARLAQGLTATDTVVLVTAGIFKPGDRAVLAHYEYGNEEVVVIGGPVVRGDRYEYTLARGPNPRPYPAHSTVLVNLGSPADGGYITIVSGDQQDALKAPHINMYAYEAGQAVRKVRLGRLSGLSAAEKARFPGVSNWNVFGLYADAAFLRGHIVADAGDIAGDLSVGGRLNVYSGIGRAGVVMGDTEAGYGLVLLNQEGRPLFGAVSPYADETGFLHDVAMFIEHEGKRGLYYHRDPATGQYRLDIAVETLVDGQLRADTILAGEGAWPQAFTGLRLGRGGLQTYQNAALQVEIDTRDGRLYFGRREGWLDDTGLTLDARVFAEGTDELEHTVHWLNRGSLGDFVGAAIGSYPGGGWFALARRRLIDVPGALAPQAIDTFVESGLYLKPGEETLLEGWDVTIQATRTLTLRSGARNVLRAEGSDVYLESLRVGQALDVSTSVVRLGGAAGDDAQLLVRAEGRSALRLLEPSGVYLDVKVTLGGANVSSNASSLTLTPERGPDGVGSVLPGHRHVVLGSQAWPFRAVYAERGHFGALGSQTALAGQFYLTRRRATLAVPLEPENEVAYFVEADLRVGEFYRFEAVDGGWEVIRIHTAAQPAGEFYEYTIGRGQDADPHSDAGWPRAWAAGQVGVSLGGNDQDGYIRLWGADDNDPDTGPAIVIFQRTNDDAPGSVAERAVFGNLNGWYGYNRNVFGVAMGDPRGAWSVVEPSGLRIMYGTAQRAFYGADIVLGSAPDAHVMLTNADFRLLYGNTFALWMDNTGLRMNVDQGARYLYWMRFQAPPGGYVPVSQIFYGEDDLYTDLTIYNIIRPVTAGKTPRVTIQTGGYNTVMRYFTLSSAGLAFYCGDLTVNDGRLLMSGNRISNVGDATEDMDALNRRTADARYQPRFGATRWRLWYSA